MIPKFSISDLLDPDKMKKFEKEKQGVNEVFYGPTRKKKLKEFEETDNSEDLNNLGVEGNKLKDWGVDPND